MKRFWKGLMEWKTAACLMYTATMVLYLFFSLLFDNREAPIGMLWSLLLVCAVASLIQGVCFSDWIFKKMRYTRRSLLFVLLFLPTLSVTAWKMEWFPAEDLGAWAIFVGMFFLIFIVMTIGFDIYFRATGRKYDGMIGRYRREKEEEGE